MANEVLLVTVDTGPSCPRRFLSGIYNSYQHQLDKLTPHILVRWVIWFILISLYIVRCLMIQGWYIVTYALGIWLLNLFIAFLSPKVDPAHNFDIDDDGPTLPMTTNEEFRPFMRRLPEFKFWYSATVAVLVATFCTFFDFFNVPVFWPILVMYFFLLFTVTMKKQILHMIQYRYLPFSYGKVKYKGKDDDTSKLDHL